MGWLVTRGGKRSYLTLDVRKGLSEKVNLSWDLKNTEEPVPGRPKGRVSSWGGKASAEADTSQVCSRTQKKPVWLEHGQWRGPEAWEKPPTWSKAEPSTIFSGHAPTQHLSCSPHHAGLWGQKDVYDTVQASEELRAQWQVWEQTIQGKSRTCESTLHYQNPEKGK